MSRRSLCWSLRTGRRRPPALASRRLGRVSFPVSCAAEASRRFERAMAVLHSFWWEEGERAFGAVLEADSDLLHGPLGSRAQRVGQPLRRRAVGRGALPMEPPRSLAPPRPSRLRTPREQGFVNGGRGALPRRRGDVECGCGFNPMPTPWPVSTGIIPGDTEVIIYYALALVATAPRTDTTFAQQRRAIALLDPLYEEPPRPPRPGALHHSFDRFTAPGRPRPECRAGATRVSLPRRRTPSTCRRTSSCDSACGTRQSPPTGTSFNAGDGARQGDRVRWTATRHGLHALDYAVYGYLQRGQDSAHAAPSPARRALKIPPAQ